MPLNAELTTIVEQLLSRTKSEGVPWTQAGSDSDFVVVVGDCPVTLSRMRSMVRDGDRRGAGTKMMVRLTVRDDGDSIVEQATVGEGRSRLRVNPRAVGGRAAEGVARRGDAARGDGGHRVRRVLGAG